MSEAKVPILLVDDRPANLLVLEAILAAPDYELVSVPSGREAVKEVERSEFAAVLLDLMMPEMDGIATAHAMRRATTGAQPTPIIILTAADTPRERILDAYAGGAVDFIQKPLDRAILRSKIAIFAELYQARRGEARRRRAEAELHVSKQRFELLVDAVTDYAIILLDSSGRVATWNEGARRIKGYDATEIVGKPFSVFYAPHERASGRPQKILEIVRDQNRFEEENWRVRRDGARFWASVVITALRNPQGEVTGFAKVTRDLTVKRAAEENARQLAAEQAAREALKREVEVNEMFVGILSHDLRSPLTSVVAGAEILLRKAQLSEQEHSTVTRIARAGARMARMTSQLLDFTRSRLGGGLPVERRPCDLVWIVRAVVAELELVHTDTRFVLSGEAAIEGRWDPDRIAQVASNLVANAAKYGSSAEPVRVSLTTDGSTDALLSVHNGGKPIDPDVLPTIFEPYVRGRHDIEAGGLGLGLYISAEIVRAHGGRIEVHSTPAEGTTFAVRLPR